MQNRIKSAALIACAFIMLAAPGCSVSPPSGPNSSEVGGGSGTGDQSGGSSNSSEEPIDFTQPVTLTVDLHGWMPTINSTPTPESPTVFNSPQRIADAFTELYPNVTIKWARTKPLGTEEELAQWFTTQINAGTVPAIAFSWGTRFQSRDWYYEMDEYLDKPNPYVEGNTKWRDLYPEYLWSNEAVTSVNGKALAIPVALYPGPATGYYYNKSAFQDAGITKTPQTLEELITAVQKLKTKGYYGIAPSTFFKNVTADQWITLFVVGPSVSGYLMDKIDYDKNNSVNVLEQLRGVKAGVYNPVSNDYARELYKQIKRYYTEVLDPGWETTDYLSKWTEGKVGIFEDGIWRMSSENNNTLREFDYGVFPAVLMGEDTTQYSSKLEYTENGPYQPDPDLVLNIMKDAVKDNPLMLEAAVRFLQFMTTPENVSELVLENGTAIGAVKNTDTPPQLNEWINQPFPKIPKARWPLGFTDEQNMNFNKVVETWVKGGMADEEFYEQINQIQQTGADDYIKKMDIDTTGW